MDQEKSAILDIPFRDIHMTKLTITCLLAILITMSCAAVNAAEIHSSTADKNTTTHCKLTNDKGLFKSSADALFDPGKIFKTETIPTIDLYLPPNEWDALQKNAKDEKYTQVEACYNGYRIGNIGMRFKGSFGTLYGCFDKKGNLTCPRLSMKLNFTKYDKSIEFFGLKRLNLNSNRFDDSRIREKLAYDLYRSMGIAAPRAYWTVVRVNDKSYGLYGMVEQVDKAFIKHRWTETTNRNLYKEVWLNDTNKSAVIKGLRTNRKKVSIDNFIKLATQIKNTRSDKDTVALLKHHTDLTYWAKYLAVDEAILSYDGITYFYTDNGRIGENHNYYIYESTPDFYTLIPWDVESSFWINPDHKPPHWTQKPDDCKTTYPYWEGLAIAPGCDPILKALASQKEPWLQAMQELLDGPFSEAAMKKQIDHHVALIGKYARAAETPTEFVTFDEAVGYIRLLIPQLRERMKALISQNEITRAKKPISVTHKKLLSQKNERISNINTTPSDPGPF